MSELKNATIKSIGKLKEFESGFTCVDFVVETSEEYPQVLKLQANKEKAENLIKYNKVGDKVDISYNLRGREWKNRDGETVVFNTIEAWKVFRAEEGVAKEPLKDEAVADVKVESDSLPF